MMIVNPWTAMSVDEISDVWEQIIDEMCRCLDMFGGAPRYSTESDSHGAKAGALGEQLTGLIFNCNADLQRGRASG